MFVDQEVYSGDVPYANDPEYLVPGKVERGEKPNRPDEVDDTLWNLYNNGWNKDDHKRPDMASMIRSLEAMS
jgi:hypothetical protein